ncbi:class I SAM-dependent methyltransferase [Streptomyces fuscichromogenes]|uniref:Transferase n=1 Tax=Streptomyces fuscichromogenes TaxID=1324013 RepID=A0A917UHH0_9ACTN|nr:class I SAM-dependent methyltransferase [Streptomyces fuscichromogenes]GGM94857.1 transferase [Streptomyces fuscichromogenes]
MTFRGTDDHAGVPGLPPLVRRALDAARELAFPYSCRAEQGRLLQVLAGGVGGGGGRIGETGTGAGVGLAWLASGARPGVRLFSVEREPERARTAAEVFHDRPDTTVTCGDWQDIAAYGPFELLVLDGGGQGKTPGDPAADVERLLVPGGTVVVDDFTPCDRWPPRFGGDVDRARLHWLEHPALRAVEIRLAPDLCTVVGTRRR